MISCCQVSMLVAGCCALPAQYTMHRTVTQCSSCERGVCHLVSNSTSLVQAVACFGTTEQAAIQLLLFTHPAEVLGLFCTSAVSSPHDAQLLKAPQCKGACCCVGVWRCCGSVMWHASHASNSNPEVSTLIPPLSAVCVGLVSSV